jgi:hypothetical protein
MNPELVSTQKIINMQIGKQYKQYQSTSKSSLSSTLSSNRLDPCQLQQVGLAQG